nr:Glycosyl hydrolases family 38 C-terminal domain protein [uncultured bacterium]
MFGELGDFAESLLQRPEQLAGLPVVPYDLADTWIHGVGTMPREVARVRELRGKLLALETRAAILEWPQERQRGEDFPLARKIAPHIDQAYEELMLFGEHTWGLDVKSTIKRAYGESFHEARQTEPYMRLEESWRAKAAYVDRAEVAFDKALKLLSEASGEGHAVLKTSTPTDSSPVGLARRLKNITKINITRGASHIEDEQRNVIENDYLRVEVDQFDGAIASLIDKRTEREWVDKMSSEPFGGLQV